MLPHHRFRSSSVQQTTVSFHGSLYVTDSVSAVQALIPRESSVKSDVHQNFCGTSLTHSAYSDTLVALSERIKSTGVESDGRAATARPPFNPTIPKPATSPYLERGYDNSRRGRSEAAPGIGQKPPSDESSEGIGFDTGNDLRCQVARQTISRPLATVPPDAAETDPYIAELAVTLATERGICARAQAVLDIYADPDARWQLGGPVAQDRWRDGAVRDIHDSGERVRAELARAAQHRRLV